MTERLIIGAPFGNYLSFPGTVSTLGTYTLHRRAGFLRRWWRVLRTVRYCRGAWFNQLGLPSPGIGSLRTAGETILSIHGFNIDDWLTLLRSPVIASAAAVELNLSCPNVTATAIREAEAVARAVRRVTDNPVIAKLPPVRPLEWGEVLHDAGVRWFHLCNTIPTPRGGVSGKPLKPFSLLAVEQFRKRFGDGVTLIGGGGITELQDVQDYLSAGADKVAVASMLFNPLNWRKVKEFVDYLEEHR